MGMPTEAGISHQCRRVERVLTFVGDKWSFPVLLVLRDGPLRFNELKRTVEGISHQMLTRTVRVLERDGIVFRTVHPTVPPQVEYGLTPLGRSLFEPLTALGGWASEHLEQIERNRGRHDASTPK